MHFSLASNQLFLPRTLTGNWDVRPRSTMIFSENKFQTLLPLPPRDFTHWTPPRRIAENSTYSQPRGEGCLWGWCHAAQQGTLTSIPRQKDAIGNKKKKLPKRTLFSHCGNGGGLAFSMHMQHCFVAKLWNTKLFCRETLKYDTVLSRNVEIWHCFVAKR